MTVFLAKGQKCAMGFNAPLRSGIVIDSRSLLTAGYADYQARLATALNEEDGKQEPAWYAPGGQKRGNNMQIDVDTKRGRTIIPGYVIGRLLEGRALEEALSVDSLPLTAAPEGSGIGPGGGAHDAVFHLAVLDIRMHDMGYGSVTFSGEIEAMRDLTTDEYRDVAERISSVLTMYRPVLLDTFIRAAHAIEPGYILQNYLSGTVENDFWQGSQLRLGIGDLFWVHRLFSVACENDAEFREKRVLCKALIYSEQPEMLEDFSIRPGMAIYPGNGNSAVIYDKTAIKPQETGTLGSMVRAQNIFYVAAEDIDRDLFYLSNDLDRKKHSQDMTLLEHQSNTIVEYQSKVSFFKGVYDDFDNSLDPQGLKVWHALEAAWQTRDRFDNVNTKLDLVEKIYNRICENIGRIQNKRLGSFMLAFTLISTLSVIVDTVDFTQGGALQPPSILRIIVLCMMGMIVIFFAFTLLRNRD